MKRTQLQIDDDLYEALRRRAYLERVSMSAVVRDVLRKGLSTEKPAEHFQTERPGFIAAGASGRDDISERHDEALREDFV